MSNFAKFLFVVPLSVLAGGCGRPAATPALQVDGKQFLLAGEPAGARGVMEVCQAARDGDPVVVVGRVGGDRNPWVTGRAKFLIVDPSLTPCDHKGDGGCREPWDYCRHRAVLPRAKIPVKFADDKGHTLAVDARELLGIKELQTVVVRGRARRDSAGNLSVVADGLYVANP
jgi:hypothetical protein